MKDFPVLDQDFLIEKIVGKYIEIQKLRILNELEKTKLVTDVNKTIVGFI